MSNDEILKLWQEACDGYSAAFWETPPEVIFKFKQLIVEQHEKEKGN